MHFPLSQPKTLTGYLHLSLYQWLIISWYFTFCQMLNNLIHIYRHAKSRNLASLTSCDVTVHKTDGCSWPDNGRPARLLLYFVGSFNDNWETPYQRHRLLCIFKWNEGMMEMVMEDVYLWRSKAMFSNWGRPGNPSLRKVRRLAVCKLTQGAYFVRSQILISSACQTFKADYHKNTSPLAETT